MVTTPQEVALMDVRKAMHLFEQVHVPIVGIVENMSYFHHRGTNEILHLFGKGGGERLAQERGVPFLGMIPLDPELCQSGDSGHSFFSQAVLPNATIDAFIHLAKQLTNQMHAPKRESQGSSHFDIKRVWQEDNHTLCIEWNDGLARHYRLSDLQKKCPCAACYDPVSKQQIRVADNEDVQAIRFVNVGRYALKFIFTTGCSHGIYDFALLRTL